MNSVLRKLPIGIQTFEDIRREGYLYVDKTALIYRLVTTGKPYFLSRQEFADFYVGSLFYWKTRFV